MILQLVSFCTLLGGVFSFYFTEFEVQQFKNFKTECYAESGLDDSAMVDFLMGGELTDQVACLIKCLYVNSGLMKEDGDLVEEKLKEAYPESWNFDSNDIEEMITVCKNITSSDPCASAVKIHFCYFDIDDDSSESSSSSSSSSEKGSKNKRSRRSIDSDSSDYSESDDSSEETQRRRRSLEKNGVVSSESLKGAEKNKRWAVFIH